MLTAKIPTGLGGETQGDGEPAASRLVDVRQECKAERASDLFMM
jgi:hypothetical protein